MIRRILRVLGTMIVCSAAVPVAVSATVLASFLFLPLPATLPEANPPEAGMVSKVYDRNGEEIGEFREFEQNVPFSPEDIPLHLKQAVIAAEDRSFYRHNGVDMRGTFRALYTDLRGGAISQGGSTITQQYVKNAYTNKERTVERKVREAILATQLDREIDKEEILFRYLSTIYLGEGAYGVNAASLTYFRKPVAHISVSEAALLAGLIPAPSRYEPRGNPEAAESKRQLVLDAMLAEGYLTPEQHADAKLQTIWLGIHGDPQPGVPITTVYPPTQAPSKHPYFVDYVRRYLIERYGADLVDKGGLQIYTTVDPAHQAAAEAARDRTLGRSDPALELAVVSVEPSTGFVTAMVGGRDFYAPGGQVNLALGGCPSLPPETTAIVPATCWDDDYAGVTSGGTGRQPGSSWKPVVLAAAYAKGIPPSKVYSGATHSFPGGAIQNYGGASYGAMSLKAATAKSVNGVYSRLQQDVGIKESAEMAKKLGISSAWYGEGKYGHGLSWSLGVLDVAPLEMASAYGVFAARGIRQEPTPILKVTDSKGNVLEDNTEREGVRVIDEAVADNVTDALRGVLAPGGTAADRGLGRPAAGKTGTAQENKDAWFVGYTPALSTAVWIGFRDTPRPMRGLLGCRQMTGGCAPAKTWQAYMNAALSDVPVTDFSEPAPIKPIADGIKRRGRQGIDPGPRRGVGGTDDGGPYVFGPGAPKAQAPAPPTTQRPSDDDDDPGDDGGDRRNPGGGGGGGDDDGGGGDGVFPLPGDG